MGTTIRNAWLLLVGLVTASGTEAAVRADYVFQNSLASSVAGAPALTDIGSGNAYALEVVDGISRTVRTFPLGNGLSLSPSTAVTANDTWSIVLLARLADVSGYSKLIDFKNGTSDNGQYAFAGTLRFYPNGVGTAAPIVANSYAQVVVTRDIAGNVVGYVDGVQQFTFLDTPADGVIDGASTLRFFIDDNVTGGGEASAGAVARIRVFDNVLSPAQVAALDRLPGGVVAPTAAAVPTLSSAMLLALALLLGLGAIISTRARAT